MNEMIEQLTKQFAAFGPSLLAGLAELVLGWFVALIASYVVRKLLSKTSVDNKLAQWLSGPETKTPVQIEQWAGKAVFYLIMLVVLIAFFSTIKLTIVDQPLDSLVQPILAYLPRLVGATVLLLVAWLLATVLKRIIGGALKATKLDEKLGGATGEGTKPMLLSKTFADVVYWLVFLIFLPPILQALELEALLAPVTTLFNKVFAFLPNIISAAAIAVVGWFIARVVQRIVQSLLASAGVDRLSEKWGLAASLGKQRLSGVLGLVLYFVILVPVLISALAALQLDAITKPASDMLDKIMAALPNIIGASIVVLIAIVIGKVVSGIVTNLLAGAGFNNVLVKLGLAKEPPQGRQAPATVVGLLVMGLIILLASDTAADMLGFQAVGSLIKDFIGFAGHILMGILIFGLGLLLAQVVAKGISTSDSRNARRVAAVVRVVILALAGAMALRQTGVADDIVNLAFGLTLGAAAVAFALAFGLGGREQAARALDEWRASETKGQPKQ
jgi:mechanosensitive ion channel-like protein